MKLFPFALFIFLVALTTGQAQDLKSAHFFKNTALYNPAALTNDQTANVTFDYRRHQFADNVPFSAFTLWADYPLLTRENKNIGAFMVSAESLQSGEISKYKRYKVSGALTSRILLNRRNDVQFGLGLSYLDNSVSLNGLSTGSQYIPGVGFDQSLDNGENSGDYFSRYVGLNAGVVLNTYDYQKTKNLIIGISLINLNKPLKSSTGLAMNLPVESVLHSSYWVASSPRANIGFDGMYTLTGKKQSITGGIKTSIFLEEQYNSNLQERNTEKHLNLFARINSNLNIAFGTQLVQEKYTLGASYNFGLGNLNEVYNNGFEIIVKLNSIINRGPKKSKTKEKKNEDIIISNTDIKEADKLANRSSSQKTQTENSTKIDSVKSNKPESDTAQLSLNNRYDTTKTDESNENTRKAYAGPIISNEVGTSHINFDQLTFEFGSAKLTQENKNYIENFYNQYLKNSKYLIKIIGHTDNIGSTKDNYALSLKRAKSVYDYLIKLGYPPNKISYIGKGETEPITNNQTEASRTKNRRIEIVMDPIE